MVKNPERKRKISLFHKGKVRSPETKEKLRVCSAIKYHKNKLKYASKQEITMIYYLEKLRIKNTFQALINNRFRVDFLLDENKVIEVDGYWHKEKNDTWRQIELEKLGYTVFRFKVDKKTEDEEYETFLKTPFLSQ